MNVDAARTKMVEQQVRAWAVLDPGVLDVLARGPRERFVPPRYRDLAFADTPIPLGHGQVMMAPNVEGRVLQALAIGPADEVLEIGTGSGFFTACLATLGGEVTSVDIFPEFVEQAKQRLTEVGLANVELQVRDASRLDEDSRYDVVAVTGSVPVYEPSFAAALRPGGRLYVTVGEPPVMEALRVTRLSEGEWLREGLFETSLPPLINAEAPPRFEF